VGDNHDDYEKSERDLRERVVDLPQERPGRLTEALLQGALGVSGGWLLDPKTRMHRFNTWSSKKGEGTRTSPTRCTDKKRQDILPLSVQVLLSTRLPTLIAK